MSSGPDLNSPPASQLLLNNLGLLNTAHALKCICRDLTVLRCGIREKLMTNKPLTVIMNGTVLIISRMKEIWKICSKIFPWNKTISKTITQIIWKTGNVWALLMENTHSFISKAQLAITDSRYAVSVTLYYYCTQSWMCGWFESLLQFTPRAEYFLLIITQEELKKCTIKETRTLLHSRGWLRVSTLKTR